jgi:hypothetical protein
MRTKAVLIQTMFFWTQRGFVLRLAFQPPAAGAGEASRQLAKGRKPSKRRPIVVHSLPFKFEQLAFAHGESLHN